MPSLTISDAIAQYRDVYLASRNLAPLTRTNYLSDLTDLARYLTEQLQLQTVEQVHRGSLEAYLATLDTRGLKGSSRRRRLAAIKGFFAFLVQQGILPRSPADELRPPARERHQPRVLTEAEYKRLREVVLYADHHRQGDAQQYERRDFAIIELFLQTGLRLAEVAKITLADLQLPEKVAKEGAVGWVRIRGKGRKGRFVTLNYKALKAIKGYLAVRPKLDEPHLFLTKFGRGMGPRAIEQMAAKYLAEAGIGGASVHTLRHTFATQHVKNGTKLDVVRQALGHESLATTSLYVELAREVMDREMQQNAL